MKKIITVALVGVLAFRSIGLGSEPPKQVKAVIGAATCSGLLSAREFSTKVLSPSELPLLKKDIQEHGWIAEIPGLESALMSNYPAEIGVHEKSGFRLAIHYSGEKIMVLSCSVPLVNGDQKEQKQMIETMLAATEALVGKDTGARRWLDTEWQRAWEMSAKLFEKESIDQKELIRKKEFGPFLVTVWGVVPDIVFLNCVRRANPERSVAR